MKYLELCRENHLVEPITIQNAYSLLNRQYEYGLSEVTQFEGIGLLAYSPLAFGALTGKYLDNNRPENARLTKFPIFNRFLNENAMKATKLYSELAMDNNLSVVELGLAFVNQQPFLDATIIGATKMNQLKQNINSVNIKLSDNIINEIEKIFNLYPDCGL